MSETVPEIAHGVGVATAVPTKLIIAVHGVGDQPRPWPDDYRFAH